MANLHVIFFFFFFFAASDYYFQVEKMRKVHLLKLEQNSKLDTRPREVRRRLGFKL